MIENGEICTRRQALTLGTQTFVHTVQVIEHDVGFWQVAQEGQDFNQFCAGNPKHRHAGARGLGGERLRAKTGIEFDNHILVVSLIRRDVQSGACSHGFFIAFVQRKE